MDEERLTALRASRSLDLNDFIVELTIRLNENDDKTQRTNERAIDLEDVVYRLLKRKIPADEDYKFTELILRDIQGELRNTALYKLSCARANVSGSTLVNF